MNRQTNVADGQPENTTPLLTLSGGESTNTKARFDHHVWCLAGNISGRHRAT